MTAETDKSAKPQMPRLGYSINEWCEATGTSRPTAYRMIKDGQLRTVRIRGHHRIPVAEARRVFGEPEAA